MKKMLPMWIILISHIMYSKCVQSGQSSKNVFTDYDYSSSDVQIEVTRKFILKNESSQSIQIVEGSHTISSRETNVSRTSGHVTLSSVNLSKQHQNSPAYYCVTCNETFFRRPCTLPQAYDLQTSPVNPCCLNTCLLKYSLLEENVSKETWKKYYTVLGWRKIGGMQVYICLCLQDDLIKPTTSNSDNLFTDMSMSTTEKIFMTTIIPHDSTESPDLDNDNAMVQPPQLPHSDSQCHTKSKCKSVDEFHTVWETCPGTRALRPCPRNGSGSSGWYCSKNGTFESVGPDFQNCTSEFLFNLYHDLDLNTTLSYTKANDILDKILKQLNDPVNTDMSYFGHEFNTFVNLVRKLAKANETDLKKLESLTGKVVSVYDSVLVQSEFLDTIEEKSVKATNLLVSIEESMLSLSKTSFKSFIRLEGTYEKTFFESPYFKISTGALQKREAKTKSRFLENNSSEKSEKSSLTIPYGWEEQIPGTEIIYVGIKITEKNVKNFFPIRLGSALKNYHGDEQRSVINGPIMSLSISNFEAETFSMNFPDLGAKIIFQHDTPTSVGNSDLKIRRKQFPDEQPMAISESSVCVYWDMISLTWSQTGCKMIETNATFTVCECQHLTAFAVLMDLHNYVEKDIVLIVLTFILCITSTVFLFISIVLLSTIRSARSPKAWITIQLCTCLLIGNLLVISVMDRNNFSMSAEVCAVSAIITHYIFLCAFTWMAIEGFVVYKMLVNVFDSGIDNKRLLHGIAYGVPFLFVLIFVILHIVSINDVYGGEMYCWLVRGYVWSFIAPVLIVVAGNVGVMIIALYKVYKFNHSTLQMKKKVKSNRTWIYGSLSLTCLLGITWIFGALLLINNSAVANVCAYIFTMFNASQGFFIFIFHCWMNENMRNVLRSKFRRGFYVFTQSESRRNGSKVGVQMSSVSTSTTSAQISKEEKLPLKRKHEQPQSESYETSHIS